MKVQVCPKCANETLTIIPPFDEAFKNKETLFLCKACNEYWKKEQLVKIDPIKLVKIKDGVYV